LKVMSDIDQGDAMIKMLTTAVTTAALLAGATVVAAGPAEAAVPACGNHDLVVTRTPTDSATGHSALWLLFRNVSHHTCTLRGYPGLDALTKHGHVLAHAKRTPSGFAGGPGAVHTVHIKPGHYASATVEWLNFKPRTGGSCRYSKAIATTPPNTTNTKRLPVSVSRCRLQIHPVVAGTSRNHRFAAAQAQWIAGSNSPDYRMGLYWIRAKRHLRATGSYAPQIAQLSQLISLPDAMRTHAQTVEWLHDVRALNRFFGTHLYL